MYKALKAEKIVATAQQLSRRIDERFPKSGLNSVAQEVCAVADSSGIQASMIRKPYIWLRVGICLLLVLLLALMTCLFRLIDINPATPSMADFVQALDAGIEVFILCGGGILFLLNAETRLKRGRALAVLNQLRSLAHVIDMHQLAKDPVRILNRGDSTQSSPDRSLDRFLLIRYLTYCSELLSILGKVSALYAQPWFDTAVLHTVDDIETLVSGLSGKIWQKIMILNLTNEDGK